VGDLRGTLGEIEYREYRPEDAEGFLRLHNSRWRGIPKGFWEEWSSRPDVTAAVAVYEGRIIGQIPLHIREFLIRPGVTVRAAFEYSVIVEEEMRGRGIGTALMGEVRRLLQGRCEVMMVYRGGERTKGYRFYRRTGHHDLVYNRLWIAGEDTPLEDRRVRHGDLRSLLENEEELLRIFHTAYAGRGGFPPRVRGYWRRALKSIIFCELPGEFLILFLEEGDRLIGYAICHERRGEKHGINLLELTTLEGEAESAVALLRHVSYLAESRGLRLTVRKPDDSVYAEALHRAGFIQIPRGERSLMTMACIFDPQALTERVLCRYGERLTFRVTVWTPQREVVLNPDVGLTRGITLEMKEGDLARLLLCRLDLLEAVKEGRVTALRAQREELESVAKAFPFTMWDYHDLDYI
jgi:GNAT superfamily N-acetyltransferase